MSGIKVPDPEDNGTGESGFQKIREAMKAITRTGFQRGDNVLRLERGTRALPVTAILRRAQEKAAPPASESP